MRNGEVHVSLVKGLQGECGKLFLFERERERDKERDVMVGKEGE
jgi:hypothetical protein